MFYGTCIDEGSQTPTDSPHGGGNKGSQTPTGSPQRKPDTHRLTAWWGEQGEQGQSFSTRKNTPRGRRFDPLVSGNKMGVWKPRRPPSVVTPAASRRIPATIIPANITRSTATVPVEQDRHFSFQFQQGSLGLTQLPHLGAWSIAPSVCQCRTTSRL
jgi:hypothetical protein